MCCVLLKTGNTLVVRTPFEIPCLRFNFKPQRANQRQTRRPHSLLQIKQRRLLFNPCKDIRDAFQKNGQRHGINPVQVGPLFFFLPPPPPSTALSSQTTPQTPSFHSKTSPTPRCPREIRPRLTPHTVVTLMTSSRVLLLGWLRPSGCLRWLSRWRML